MAILQASNLTYNVSLDDMKKLIAKDLDVPVDAITVRYVIGSIPSRFDDNLGEELKRVEVTVDQLKVESSKAKADRPDSFPPNFSNGRPARESTYDRD